MSLAGPAPGRPGGAGFSEWSGGGPDEDGPAPGRPGGAGFSERSGGGLDEDGPAPRLNHHGLLYGSDEEFLAAAVPFCRDGVENGDAVLAVTTPGNIGLLRDALGGAAGRVEFVVAEQWYDTPGRALAEYFRYVGRHTAEGGLARVLGEPVWHGRSPLETAEWTRYEAVVNLAFAASPAWIVCPYDTRVTSPGVVADSLRTHPRLLEGTGERLSDSYAPPTDESSWGRPVPPPPPGRGRTEAEFEGGLAPLRAFVGAAGLSLGMSREGAERLVLAANEVATNAVRHGGGRGRAAVWRDAHQVVCDITDPGSGGADEAVWYAGYVAPDPCAPSGHGLWAVRQLCELVELETGPRGTTVRLRLALR
ncbi:histidine kinase-like protein [Actinocorallia herbida]|uniref:Histidine kinase-like protein n=1 Tax=Actinocorallia herbida TaxID=58109 RepID=A0A3N1D808_9ACTN|nr:sensor histidine kinase [Actinocorallia herbida]ROO89660.1 histidine kinase-like protein [Actinocorallia herbida]